jgi:hypothetical protein
LQSVRCQRTVNRPKDYVRCSLRCNFNSDIVCIKILQPRRVGTNPKREETLS